MRRLAIAALFATLPWATCAAPTWQVVSSEPGKRIELDRTSIKRDEAGKVQATGRIILEKELPDVRTGANYRIIEATTRYDCAGRNAATIKRVYRKGDGETLREEEQSGPDLPVRTGTLDDKVLREVCRPESGKADVKEVAQKANEAAGQLKKANETLVSKELAKASGSAAPIKTAEGTHGAPVAKPEAADKTAVRQEAAAPVEPPKAVAPRPAAVVHATTRHNPPRREKPSSDNHEPTAVTEHAQIHWSYDGEGAPDNWARLDAKNRLCAVGQRQSPIDIRDGIKVDLEPIAFDYKPSLFRIVDNGHTVQVNVGNGSITVTGKTYELVQFHFHKPSEEKINGRAFDMVAHLVHRADDGQLAVVAVLLEKGAENPFIQTLWNNLPLEKNSEVSPPTATVDLLSFLPPSRNYFTYMGSLTTPPCTEGVLWLVLRQAVPISAEQVNIFSRLYRNNARPVQPAAGRLIKEGR